MILIISLQKKETKCDICGFWPGLSLFILVKKQCLIARKMTAVINWSISSQQIVNSILNFSQSRYLIRVRIKECLSFSEGFQVIYFINTKLIVDCYKLSCFFYHIRPKVHDRIQNLYANKQPDSYELSDLTSLASLPKKNKAQVFVLFAVCQ